MVVLQIDVDRIFAVPCKSDAPMTAGVDGKSSFATSLEPMEAQPREVHILWPDRRVEPRQDHADTIRILDTQLGPIAGFGKTAKGLAAERSDHIDV